MSFKELYNHETACVGINTIDDENDCPYIEILHCVDCPVNADLFMEFADLMMDEYMMLIYIMGYELGVRISKLYKRENK